MNPTDGVSKPPADVESDLRRGWDCLRRRTYGPARAAFEQVLMLQESSGSALEGLAAAALYLDDLDTARSAYTRAYRAYLDHEDVRGAARAAMQTATYHEAYRGESAIASGWFERAQSLLETIPLSPEHVWLAFYKAHVDIHLRGDVASGERNLQNAMRLNETCPAGEEFELLTRGLLGLTAISEGRIDAGLRRLDEATTAAAAGELTTAATVGWAYCYTLSGCEHVLDFERADQWLRRYQDTKETLGVRHYASFCRAHYIGLLTWRGEYAAAEEETAAMRRELADVAPLYLPFGDIRLGEIRRRQGRVDEASALLEPHASNPLAMLSLAAIALDTDQLRTCVEIVERYLRRVGSTDRVRRLHGLDLLVRAHARLRDLEAMRTALAELEELAAHSGTPLMRAFAREGCALAAAAANELDEARRLLEDAIDDYDRNGVPYEGAAARLRLGETLVHLRRDAPARKVLEAALAAADRIDAAGLAKQARRAIAGLQTSDARRDTLGLTARELDVLVLVAQGVSNQQIGESLSISAFTVKRHIGNILTKLDLPTRAAAAAFAIREGVIK
jgi:LuxR family maltose regulon positive regulatory protein